MRLSRLPTGDGGIVELAPGHYAYPATCGYYVSGPTSEVTISADIDGVISMATLQLLSETDHVLAPGRDPRLSPRLATVLAGVADEQTVLWLAQQAHQADGRTLLFGCGAGGLLARLAAEGCLVDGVESRRSLAHAVAAATGSRVFVAEPNGFHTPAGYGLAIAGPGLFSSLTDDWSALRHLRMVAESLRPGGRYLLHTDFGERPASTTVGGYRLERSMSKVDHLRRVVTERCTIRRAGDSEIVAEIDVMRRVHTPATLFALFTTAACFQPVEIGEAGGWLELTKMTEPHHVL